jgi:hypothetical protein
MIDMARLGRKKIMQTKQGIASGRREKKCEKWHVLEENGQGLPYIFTLLVGQQFQVTADTLAIN